MSAGPTSPPTVREDEDVVSPSLAARLHVTLGKPGRRFRAGEDAPAGTHWCLAPEAIAIDRLGPDGIAATGIIPDLDLPRRMWAGAEIEAHRPFRVGDRVVRCSSAGAPTRKQGRSGPLAFVEITHVYTVEDEPVLVERQTLVYRAKVEGSAAGTGPEADGPPPGSTMVRRLRTTPLQVFRFSALTFNAHLIHLAPDYARSFEGYPDILVQGTLTAALLLDAALEHGGAADPWTASIRALAPLGCGDLAIWAQRTEGGVFLIAASHAGPVMRAALRKQAAREGASRPTIWRAEGGST